MDKKNNLKFSSLVPAVAKRLVNRGPGGDPVVRPRGTNLWIIEYIPAAGGFVQTPTGERQDIPGSSCLLIRAGVYQNYGIAENAVSWEHYFATFTPRDYWLGYCNWPEVYPGFGLLTLTTGAATRSFFQEMVDDFARRTARREEFLYNNIERLLLQLDCVNPLSRAGGIDPRVRAAMEFTRENFRRTLALGEIAAAVNLSPSRLHHLFAAEAGITPMKYLEQQRLESARTLLALTAAPIKEISARCGFTSQFYFSRAYKRAFGTSPSARREKTF